MECLQLIFGHEGVVVSTTTTTTTLRNKPNQRVSFHCLPLLVVVRHSVPIAASYSKTFKCRQQAGCQICLKCFRLVVVFWVYVPCARYVFWCFKGGTASIFSGTESGLTGCWSDLGGGVPVMNRRSEIQGWHVDGCEWWASEQLF
jgi:hypothetical protein